MYFRYCLSLAIFAISPSSPAYLGFSQQKLQIPPTEYTVVFYIARNIHRACPVNSSMDFHVGVNDVQISLLILQQQQENILHVSSISLQSELLLSLVPQKLEREEASHSYFFFFLHDSLHDGSYIFFTWFLYH